LATVAALSKDRRASTSVEARDDLEDLGAEGDEERVDGGLDALALVVLGGLLEEGLVLGHLDGLEDEARVGRGVQRLEGLHGGEVTGVGDDLGVLAELLECVHIRKGRSAWEKGQGCPARVSGRRVFSGHLSLVSTGGLVQIAACASR